jgi:hypothetical protein
MLLLLLSLRAWTGMHGPNMHAIASAAAATTACMRACVAACVIDTMYGLIYASAQTQVWRIKCRYINIDVF